MAITTFKAGKVTIAGNTLGENPTVTLAINIDMSDRTRIGDTWRRVGALGKNYTITATVKYDPDDTAQAALRTEFISGDGEVGSVRVYEGASHYFLGSNCIITGFQVAKTVGSDDEVSLTFEGDGLLQYS